MIADAAEARGRVEDFQKKFSLLKTEIGKEIVGYSDEVEKVLISLFAGGHVLLEGVPGIGKTTLVRVLSKALNCEFSRIQFSPDLMPADIVGTNVLVVGDDGSKEFPLPAGPGLREHRARRRDQPRDAEDAVGAARGDAGALA